jgi:putative transposase
MTPSLRQALRAQYNAHKSWSARLHHDNLVALAETRAALRPVPSYATVRRFLAAHGLTKRRPMTTRQTEGALMAAARLEAREVRSYESEYSAGLWHWNCHNGSRKVLTPRGEWRTPELFGVLDDHSRLVCHLQWYLSESAENIAHGLSQAMLKRGLARAAMSDNGAAMTATEITEGLPSSCHSIRQSPDGTFGKPRPARHPSSNHTAVFPIRQRQAGDPIGVGRGPADGHARGCR